MVKNNNSNDERIIISFSSFPFAFRAVKCKDFTNYLFDENDFFKKFSLIFRKIVPELEQSNIVDLTKKDHCNNIEKKRDIVIDILKELVKEEFGEGYNFETFYDNNISEYQLYELGIMQGIRLICIKYNNIFKVLFIDYHHLIFLSVKYNQLDYSSFKFCPIKGIKE